MIKLSDLIEQNKELFATIEAWDNGMHFTFTTAASRASKISAT
jgi:hypothetical protein